MNVSHQSIDASSSNVGFPALSARVARIPNPRLARQLAIGSELKRRPRRLNLAGFVKSLEPEIRTAVDTNADIVFEFGSDDCFAFVDPAKLREVIVGLCLLQIVR